MTQASASLLEGGLRRATAFLRLVADMMEKENKGDPVARELREAVAEYRKLLGDA